jgi:aspartyl/asparaginyl-tRNA synthetase
MHTTPLIDYAVLQKAIQFYTKRGYISVETPWIISHDAYLATKPEGRPEFYTLGGYLVASGEQGFIQLLKEGKDLTKCFTITPCFRDEQHLDATHYRYFIKLELFNKSENEEELRQMINDAYEFFSLYTEVSLLKTEESPTSHDIVQKRSGVELGSYGIRNTAYGTFIYGTGVALPRLSVVL